MSQRDWKPVFTFSDMNHFLEFEKKEAARRVDLIRGSPPTEIVIDRGGHRFVFRCKFLSDAESFSEYLRCLVSANQNIFTWEDWLFISGYMIQKIRNKGYEMFGDPLAFSCDVSKPSSSEE